MKNYGIQSSLLTMMVMGRSLLITQEKAKKAYEQKLLLEWIYHPFWITVKKEYIFQDSIYEDLETFVQNHNSFKNIEIKKECNIRSFSARKLTEDELKLVEERNDDHLKSYWWNYLGKNPDIDQLEMARSESRSKYVFGWCQRWTYILTTKKKINCNLI